jgi:hypothetical protein
MLPHPRLSQFALIDIHNVRSYTPFPLSHRVVLQVPHFVPWAANGFWCSIYSCVVIYCILSPALVCRASIIMLRCLFLFSLLCHRNVSALFAHDAGILDFLIPTTGHGPNTMNAVTVLNGSAIITYSPQSCYFASRRVESGHLMWRRNLCYDGNSTSLENSNVIDVAISADIVVTLDASSLSRTMIRGWDTLTGALIWDRLIMDVGQSPEIWTIPKDNNISHVAVGVFGKVVYILNAASGTIVTDFSRKDAEHAKPHVDVVKSVTCFDRTINIDAGTKIQVIRGTSPSRVTSNLQVTYGSIDSMLLLTCSEILVTVLLTSKRGTTSQLTVSGNSDEMALVWTHEEGLAQITSAIMVDASHEDIIKGQHDAVAVLQLPLRLKLQWIALKNFLASKAGRRDHVFGFVKIAVMVSSSSHRVYGIETAGDKRSMIRYQVDLPDTAIWHRMIHGSVNAKVGVHSINGRAQTRDVLIVSYTEDSQRVDWVCLDGTIGKVHDTGSFHVSSPVAQILPISGIGSCRQNALLVLKDDSLVNVFDDNAFPDSLYAHVLDRSTSTLKSFGVSKSQVSNATFDAHPVGMTSFPGEVIISVAYPSRDEVVASPCEILGDDSLLLKYLNPHLAVLISMTSDDILEEEFHLSPVKTTTQKRKPAGVTKGIYDTTWKTNDTPNLFVSLIDTISGQVIYRASHSNVLPNPQPNVIISENWVFYTFSNGKTRKAELVVLTLYEGMIDKKSLTAFSSPEHQTKFSSFDTRETKPVILAKTFTVPMAVTALGVTTTRSGVSVRRLLLAGMDGQIHGVDQKLLEPRRPLGPLKEIEKKEGLLQYHELIQTIPYQSLTYNQTVHSVRSIISAPTDLESQSLILAFGGPDIFFTRTSPSRGFDLLPDNFNKLLLSIVVFALIAIMVVMQKILTTKIRKHGWI